MMDDEDTYMFLSGFVAGYYAALPEGIDAGDLAVDAGLRDLDRYHEGRCLICHRSGIALMDGFFCGRCYPAIPEAMEDD